MLKNCLYQNAHDTRKLKCVHIRVFTIKNETDIKSVGHNNTSRNHDRQRDFHLYSCGYDLDPRRKPRLILSGFCDDVWLKISETRKQFKENYCSTILLLRFD